MSADVAAKHAVDIIPPEGAPRAWQTVEATVSVFFAFVVGFVLFTVGGLVVFSANDSPDFRWLLPTWIVAVLAEGAFLCWLKSSLEVNMRPLVPGFALRQPRWPIVLRPVVCCWWIAHFMLAAAALWLVEALMLGDPARPLHVGVRIAALGAFVWMLTHCSLLYLFLALTSLRRDERLVALLWRWRVLIDVLLTVAILFAPRVGGR